jgi:hypothetical protein
LVDWDINQIDDVLYLVIDYFVIIGQCLDYRTRLLFLEGIVAALNFLLLEEILRFLFRKSLVPSGFSDSAAIEAENSLPMEQAPLHVTFIAEQLGKLDQTLASWHILIPFSIEDTLTVKVNNSSSFPHILISLLQGLHVDFSFILDRALRVSNFLPS